MSSSAGCDVVAVDSNTVTRRLDATERQQWATRCADFLRHRVGLPVAEVLAVDGFLPAIRVENGGLLIDVERAFPGDVLHDAGHLAVIPSRFRAQATGDLHAVGDAMNAWLQQNNAGLEQHPEDPTCRQVLQSSEAEAIAWQYAAAARSACRIAGCFLRTALMAKARRSSFR